MGKYHPHGDSSHLRRAGAHGAGLLAARPAGRRPRQLRLARRRCPGGHALHRGAADEARRASCSASSARRPSTSGRTTTARASSRSCCRRASRTCWSTAARASRSAWRPHPAAQPGRGRRRAGRADRRPRSSRPRTCSSTSRARTSRPAASCSRRKKELREIYENGQGALKLRGEWKLEERQARRQRTIVITSIPYAREASRRSSRRSPR